MERDVEEWGEHAYDAVRAAGYKAGGARRAVIELLARQECCLTAQEIFDRLRAGRRQVGVATVYRVLELLAELRLVQRVDLGDGLARFEPLLPDGEHHHHLVCDGCGKVEVFADARLESALERAAATAGYSVAAHEVVLRGACADCRPA